MQFNSATLTNHWLLRKVFLSKYCEQNISSVKKALIWLHLQQQQNEMTNRLCLVEPSCKVMEHVNVCVCVNTDRKCCIRKRLCLFIQNPDSIIHNWQYNTHEHTHSYREREREREKFAHILPSYRPGPIVLSINVILWFEGCLSLSLALSISPSLSVSLSSTFSVSLSLSHSHTHLFCNRLSQVFKHIYDA